MRLYCKRLRTTNKQFCFAHAQFPPRSESDRTHAGETRAQRDACPHVCSLRALTSLPERLGELKTLQTLRLEGCSGLVTLPDLSGLAQLETEGLPVHLQPWDDSGHKAGTFSSESRPSSPPADGDGSDGDGSD